MDGLTPLGSALIIHCSFRFFFLAMAAATATVDVVEANNATHRGKSDGARLRELQRLVRRPAPLRPKFTIGSVHGRAEYELGERVFHRTDMPEKAVRAAQGMACSCWRL